MMGVVESISNKQLECVSSMSRRPQNTDSDERNVKEIDMQNRNSRSRVNLTEPENEGPYRVT